MELLLLCSLILFSILISVSLGFLFPNKSSNTFHTNLRLPPGKMGLPYIGETLAFINAARKCHPEKFMNDRISKYSSKVFKTSILTEPSIFMCGAEGNNFLFSNEYKLFTTWYPSALTKVLVSDSSSADTWEIPKLKKMLYKVLQPESLMRYVAMMDSIAQSHFESCWEGKQQVTVSPLVKTYTFAIAAKLFFNIEDAEQIAKLYNPFNVLVSGAFSIPIDLPGTALRNGIKASKVIKKEMRSIMEQRKIDLAENKASPTQDLLSILLLATDENGVHPDGVSILDLILGVLVAGYETSSSVISCLVKFLSDFPHIHHQVLKEQMEIVQSKSPGQMLTLEDIGKMKYSWNVACEVMRLVPPIPGGFKEASQDFTFKDFLVPKGWKLYWSASYTHMDPECFPEPEKFDPTRFEGNGPAPHTFIPFAGGPRICPGKDFARLEILVFLHNLVKRFTWEKIISNEKIKMNPMPVLEKGLPIRLIPLDAKAMHVLECDRVS